MTSRLRKIGASDWTRKILGLYWPLEVPTVRPADWSPVALSAPAPVPTPFEVNMMEPLAGWKGWKLDGGLLCSPAYPVVWSSDRPFEARCTACAESPSEGHSCGIYAADSAEAVQRYGVFHGEVWGWGRYVRGSQGWRAQFAYPKSFHLKHGQADLIEALKRYHVPIFIDEPLRVYDPEEEGYFGYRNSEEDGHRGTAEDAPAGEEGDCDAQATGS
jgi:hypothetical protein